MPLAPSPCVASRLIALGLAVAASPALSQGVVLNTPAAVQQQAAQAGAAAAASNSSRFVAACQDGLARDQLQPGCRGVFQGSEIERLKEEALRSNSGRLYSLLGAAYDDDRSGSANLAQAYRWYLLAAVRGDARAAQRLSEMYQTGRGAPEDRVRALGYARLTQRLSSPDSSVARQARRAESRIGRGMASDEIDKADQFAQEMESAVQQQRVLPHAAEHPELAPSPTVGAAPAPSTRYPTSAPTGIPGLPGDRTGVSTGPALPPAARGNVPGAGAASLMAPAPDPQ